MTDTKDFEVIIIGGSYAGLSAAMALGRSLRRVLVIDSGLPCNRQTPHSHNFLTLDGNTPFEISSLAKQQVEAYKTVIFYDGIATSGTKTEDRFEITTHTNDWFTAKKLIVATGISDEMLDIKGFDKCWGISIIHCPYCHGYEYRQYNTGIITNGDNALHLASLASNLTDQVTLLTNGEADFSSEQLAKLARHHIQIIETNITAFEHQNGQLQQAVFEDGTKRPFDAVYASLPSVQQSNIPASLGCALTEHGHIEVDSTQKTTVDGVYACGDNSNMMRSIANAVYTGNKAGAIVNGELAQEQF